MTGDTNGVLGAKPRLEALIRRARMALLWEQTWPVLARLMAVVVLFLTVSWFGLWDALSPMSRAIGVGLFLVGFLAAAFPLLGLAAPERGRALQRIDAVTGRAHRPATAIDDRLAATGDDAFTRALWQAHQTRADAAADALRVGLPSPRLSLRDPRAFHFLLALVAVVAFFVAGEDRGGRLMEAFNWRAPAAEVIPPRLDAWVAPPAYTGRAPLFLTGAAAAGEEPRRTIAVPVGSVVVVRTSGGEVKVTQTGSARSVAAEGKPSPGAREERFVLDGDASLEVSGAGLAPRNWAFSTIADKPPTIALKNPPAIAARGAFTLAYQVADDYGVTGAEAQFEQRMPPGQKKAGQQAGPPPRPLYDPPKAALTLPQARTRSGEAMTNVDLLEHPWAGAAVTLGLVARDEAGQEGRSEKLDFTLPARTFANPLARALVEQRRKLALDATARERVGRALDALAALPERFTPDASIYLGLRTAYWRLTNASGDEDLRGAADYLWELALAIEDGDLTDAERALRQAERALQEALDRNASDEEIKRLTDQLRQAMNEFLKELAKRAPEAERNARQDPNARTIRPQDLQNMIDRMEQMARRGDRQGAKDLLAELRQTLDNLRNARRQQQRNPNAEAMSRMLDELGNMIREQNQLRDRTFREGKQGQRGRQGQQGQRRPGQRGQQGQQGQQGEQGEGEEGDMGDLADAQRALRERLDQLKKQLQGMGGEGDPNLGEAGEAMQGAEGALGEGNAGGAVDQQARALEALRKGAQSMAGRMMGDGPDGEPGPDGAPSARRGPGGEDNLDPLGRPTRSRTYDSGNSVKVPGEIDAQRARRVLEDIRRRLSEPSRPKDELDYLERLLEE